MAWWDWFARWGAGASAQVAATEALLDADYEDPDLNVAGNQNSQYWRRLTQSAADLSPLTHDRMQQIALHLFDRNPLGKRILELVKDFVVGEGFTPTAKDERVQEAIESFWNDAQNNLDERSHAYALELGLWGEQAHAAFVNEASGQVRLVSIDPRTIKAVHTDPLNPDRALAVCLAPAANSSERRYLRVIQEGDSGLLEGQRPGETLRAGDETVRYYEPPDLPSGTRLAGCFLNQVNKVQGATRGRSDLLPVADFVDLYDRLVFDEAERMSFLRAFVWLVTVKNATAQQLKDRAATEPVPKPGSVKFANENETWQALSPDLKGQDSQNVADLILSLIATGAGLPKHWLNGIMDVNRASASEMGEPALKRLVARQKVVVGGLRQMVRFALEQQAAAGALAQPADGFEFTISAAEMSARDLEKASRSLLAAVQALGMADAANWIDDETAQQAIVLLLGQMGVEIDLQEMQERIEQQQAEDAENDQYELPGYLGKGAEPGSEPLAKAMRADAAGQDVSKATREPPAA